MSVLNDLRNEFPERTLTIEPMDDGRVVFWFVDPGDERPSTRLGAGFLTTRDELLAALGVAVDNDQPDNIIDLSVAVEDDFDPYEREADDLTGAPYGRCEFCGEPNRADGRCSAYPDSE